MLERLVAVPAEPEGIRGIELVHRSGVEMPAGFPAKVVRFFRDPRDSSGQPLAWLRGLDVDLEQQVETGLLLHDSRRGPALWALLAASLATCLERRLGGGEVEFQLEPGVAGPRITFEAREGCRPSFCLLYSVAFLHDLWLDGAVEPRQTQLLEVADLFFRTGADVEEGPVGLPGLDMHFPQEVMNSFVNLIHPQPRHLGNQLVKILLLEDNHELGEIIADMLSSVGFVVCQAPDGVSGLSRLERERFQLILSDIQMPRLNGIGLLKALRDLHMDVPVILTTGFTGVWQEEQVLQQGAVAFLPKPFGMAELIRVVDQALAGAPAPHSG
jgi:CheY-like chemotaxis protein